MIDTKKHYINHYEKNHFTMISIQKYEKKERKPKKIAIKKQKSQ